MKTTRWQQGGGNRAIGTPKTCSVARHNIKLNHFASLDNISWLRPCMFNSLLGRTSWTCAFLQTLMVFQEVSCRPASGDLDSSAPLHKRTTNTERNKLAEITRRNQWVTEDSTKDVCTTYTVLVQSSVLVERELYAKWSYRACCCCFVSKNLLFLHRWQVCFKKLNAAAFTTMYYNGTWRYVGLCLV